MLKFSGDYLVTPFYPSHDYVLVQNDASGMLYSDHTPECLKNFAFIVAITHEVIKLKSMS